jgi:DNA (cytosine-5)-methyltransferase 1
MKIGSLCSGYGGLDLAVEQLTDAKTVWFSEFNSEAAKIYSTHYNVPNLGDLTKIDWTQVEPVDIITGGYPCQPFSHAGNRKGQNDSRHLFPYIKNAISTLRPSLVCLENVRGHLSLGFDSVLQDLTEIGYDALWTLARASAIGAPHRRERLFIIAFPNANTRGERLQESDTPRSSSVQGRQLTENLISTTNTLNGKLQRIWKMPELGFRHNPRHNLPTMQDWGRYTTTIKRWEHLTRLAPSPLENGKLSPLFVEWLMGLPEGWVTDVNISRTQQLKALGNGVVPQQAFQAYKHLLGVLNEY